MVLLTYMEKVRCVFLALCFWSSVFFVSADSDVIHVEYSNYDSIKVMELLRTSAGERGQKHRMLYFGEQLAGVPYIAHTLENGNHEHLIVNLRQLDCTTFVETVLALSLCDKNEKYTFEDFCGYLLMVRYREGVIRDYTSRLHYFSWWVEDNERKDIICEITSKNFPFVAAQTVKINYMSTHPSLYKHLSKTPDFVGRIKELEDSTNGRRYRYIPKRLLNGDSSCLSMIQTGDIIAILTNKEGLDTSHIGIAVWKGEKLHLMHASSLYGKVVLDTKTFYDYSLKQKSQIGVRVFRMK